METRANYVAIGLFVIAVITGALGFVYWLYASSDQGRQRIVEIVFPEAVTGLSVGSQVLFNGIRVGDVTRLGFPATGGTNVIAEVRVNADAPVKADTRAELGFQGLTGVAYVSLTGGSADAPSLFAGDDIPRIQAQQSRFQSILETGQQVLSRADRTLATFNEILDENRGSISATVRNVETFSAALSESAPQISGLIDDVSAAGRALADAGPGIRSLVARADSLIAQVTPEQIATIAANLVRFSDEAAQLPSEVVEIVDAVKVAAADLQTFTQTAVRVGGQVETIVAAVDPEAVRGIFDGGRTLVTGLAARTEDIGTLITNVGEAAGSINAVASNVASKNDRIAAVIDGAARITENIETASAQLPELVETVRPGLENLNAVLVAVDAEAVRSLVADAASFVGGLEAQSERIASLIANADGAAGSIREVAAVVAERSATIGTAIDDAGAIASDLRTASGQVPELVEALRPGIENLSAILTRIAPARIDDIVSNVQIVTAGLAQRSGQIGTLIDDASATVASARSIAENLSARNDDVTAIVANVRSVSQNADAFAGRLSGLLDRVEPGIANLSDVFAAIDPEAVRGVVESVRAFAADLETQSEPIATLIATANSAAANIDAVAANVAARNPEIAAIIEDATAIAENVRVVTAQAPELLDAITPGLENLNAALVAIDPAAVGEVVANVRAVARTVADQRPAFEAIVADAGAALANARSVTDVVAARQEDIGAVIANARTFSERINVLAEQAGPAVEEFTGLLASIDTETVNAITTGLREVVETVAARRDDIAATIENARAATADVRQLTAGVVAEEERIRNIIVNVESASASIDQAVQRVAPTIETLARAIEGPGVAFLEDGAEAAREIAVVARAFAQRADSIAGGVNRFANAGLDDVRALVNQGRSTLVQIERAVANFDRAPNRVLFGGDGGPNYSPQRR